MTDQTDVLSGLSLLAPGGFVHPQPIVLAVPLLVDVGNDYALQDEPGGFDCIQGGGCEVDAIPEGCLV
eukprot:1764388-Pyramimonas_sp.AAC.1